MAFPKEVMGPSTPPAGVRPQNARRSLFPARLHIFQLSCIVPETLLIQLELIHVPRIRPQGPIDNNEIPTRHKTTHGHYPH